MAAVESGQSGVWWSSWISTAKERSVSALNATKRDLAEFVSVVGADAKAVVKEASENINKILISSSPSGEEDGKDSRKNDAVIVDVPPETPYDRCQAELFAVQSSSETYLQDPTQGEESDFKTWKSTFDIHSYQTDISNTLVSCSHVRTKHSQLVPAKVSYETFWTRYFYKMHRLEKKKKQRADLMARASNRAQEQLQWDEETEDVVGKPLVLKVDNCGHQRSESSTDSFVCVSEDTGLEAESAPSHNRDEPDTDSWEHLGSELGGSGSRNSRAKLSEMGEEDVASGVLSQKEDQSILQSIELIVAGDKDGKKAGERDSNSSEEWEDWDD